MSAQTPPGFPKAKGDYAGAPTCPDTGQLRSACDCKKCTGTKSQHRGKVMQRKARRALEHVTGTKAARFSGQAANEESWRLTLRVEVKSGAYVDPIWTRYAAAEAQSHAAKAVGDTRKFAMVAMGSRTPDGLFICRLSELDRVIEALVNA